MNTRLPDPFRMVIASLIPDSRKEKNEIPASSCLMLNFCLGIQLYHPAMADDETNPCPRLPLEELFAQDGYRGSATRASLLPVQTYLVSVLVGRTSLRTLKYPRGPAGSTSFAMS